MKVIADTTGLMLAIPVYDYESGNCVDISLLPIVAWSITKPHKNFPVRITPVAVGTDNTDEGMKIVVYNEMTGDWYVCNADSKGNCKSDLIEYLNINNFLNEDVEDKDNE